MFCRQLFLILLLLLSVNLTAQSSKNPLIQKGWDALIKDQDNEAFGYFSQAYEKAKKENNTADKAESLLSLGISSYGASLENGLRYATKSLENYTKLEVKDPHLSKVGRGKCLQLISTIYTRQGKYTEAIPISREVIQILTNLEDKSGTLGLAYSNMGTLFEKLKQSDSAIWFYKQALIDYEKSDSKAYLPSAYIKMGEYELQKKNTESSLIYFNKALSISQKTENKQAEVSSLNAIGKWSLAVKNGREAQQYFQKAIVIAESLSDKTFEIKTLRHLITLQEQQQNYPEIARLQKRLLQIEDEFYSLEKAKIIKNLEVQFDITEKNRKLVFISKEKEIAKLTNYLLGICILVLIIIFATGYISLKSIHKRDKQLLKTKEALVDALEKQRELEETKYKNDLDHKESQLSAITLQMLQKNELLGEIKTAIEHEQPLSEQQLIKMLNRHLEHNNNWDDFNLYFESINKNFYTRLKQAYPEISANDLRICALIKLNLSIKEMSSILNISPDSVKTARYRLRKKLQMGADDKLTDFILSV